MKAVNPYLNFNGNAEEAFEFYRSVFGGEFSDKQKYSQMPDADKLPPGVGDLIMHIALPLGEAGALMGSDTSEAMGQKAIIGTNNYIMIQTESEQEADRLFAGLSAGGKVEVPLQKMFWGDYYGSLADKFGVMWMIIYSYER